MSRISNQHAATMITACDTRITSIHTHCILISFSSSSFRFVPYTCMNLYFTSTGLFVLAIFIKASVQDEFCHLVLFALFHLAQDLFISRRMERTFPSCWHAIRLSFTLQSDELFSFHLLSPLSSLFSSILFHRYHDDNMCCRSDLHLN